MSNNPSVTPDLLVGDEASRFADSLSADERRLLLGNEELGDGSEAFTEDEEEVVLNIFNPAN